MPKKVSGWQAEDGNVYETEEEAVKADAKLAAINEIASYLSLSGVVCAIPNRLLAIKIIKRLENYDY